MKLIEKINQDFLDARKSKNVEISTMLSSLKGEIDRRLNKSTENNDILPTVKKFIENCLITNTETTLKEAEYLKKYVDEFSPKLLSEEEITTIITNYLNSGTEKTFPILMKKFQTDYKGKADNKIVSSVINNIVK